MERRWKHLLIFNNCLHALCLYMGFKAPPLLLFHTVHIKIIHLFFPLPGQPAFLYFLRSSFFLLLRKPPFPLLPPCLSLVSTLLPRMKGSPFSSFYFHFRRLLSLVIDSRVAGWRSLNLKDVTRLSLSFYCFSWDIFLLVFAPVQVTGLLI